VACGSGGDFLDAAIAAGCEVLVTGEARFHTSLAAEASNIALVLAGHYATERFGVEHLAKVLAEGFVGLDVWGSRAERDPLRWY
jgi:putative NIF3 family GTP cyclohydrolase 1 type 2